MGSGKDEEDGSAPLNKARRTPDHAFVPPQEDTVSLRAQLVAAEEIIVNLKLKILRFQGLEQSLRGALDDSDALRRRLLEAEQASAAIRRSVSWRITAPIRWARALAGRLLVGVRAWILFEPDSRPHRTFVRLVESLDRLRPGPAAADPPIRYLFVDHTVACSTNTGVQRVVRGLAKAMLEAGDAVRFVKWNAAEKTCVLIDAEEREHLGRWNGPPLSQDEAGLYRAKGARSVSVGRGRQTDAWLIVPEVTHLTFHEAPVTETLIRWAKSGGLKCGFVFYDAIPLRRPEFAETAPTHARYMRELRLADVIWPISRWSADELASLWGVARDADDSYLPYVRPIHLPSEFDRPRVLAAEPGDKLILCVGTVEPRKNQTALIRAFQAIVVARPDCGWRLTLAGHLHPDVAQDVQAATQPGSPIQWLGHIGDAELSDLYARCAFTVFPSLDEGFGLPILESLWLGKPCLCADFGAMREVAAGGGCLTVDVSDPAQLKSALERLMDDDTLRRSLSEAAVRRPMPRWTDYLNEIRASMTGSKGLVYVWVDATISYSANTGIQRVTRQLARGLIEAGFRLVPVKWGSAEQPFCAVSAEELAHFARWNGPAPDLWHPWVAPEDHRGGGWLIMPELPLNLSEAEQQSVRRAGRAAGLKSAAIFYDTIPWKMRDIYPPAFADAHRSYIRELANYDLVLPISQYSREEMSAVLEQEFQLSESELGHIQACLLPAEFPEQSQAKEPAVDHDGVVEIICVGTVEPRKNHERLLDAFELACQTSDARLHLTIAGGGLSFDPELAERVRARVAASLRVDWEEDADDVRVKQLYRRCDFTVYPSVEEGFGVPILESLWHAKPVICADFGAMLEVAAEGGGCVTVDVRDIQALAQAIANLANSPSERQRLADEARLRSFRTWGDYAHDVSDRLGLWTYPSPEDVRLRRAAMGLSTRPKLSVCISTYNRAAWLSTSLRNIATLYPHPVEGVEFLICDNASSDHTPAVVRPFMLRSDAVYRRNRENVGMLGNLRETAASASGDYIWILGDDDLLKPGSVEKVLEVIKLIPEATLIYLNYAHTSIEDPRAVVDFGRFFAEAIPITPPEEDLTGPIREICARNENFFTAIYTLVFRRDHALKAYSQDTSGRPFSSMLTCIPTTHYVLHHMMGETGVWIGSPQVVVNLNVSWAKYAPLWILERIPEVYMIARQKGVDRESIDRWRRHTLNSVEHFFEDIFAEDPLGNAAYFSAARLVRHFCDLPEFQAHRPKLLDIYRRAHASGHQAATEPPSRVFGEAE